MIMEDFDIIINMCLEKRCTGKFILKNGKIISSKNIGITSLPDAPYIVGNLCYDKKGVNVVLIEKKILLSLFRKNN